MIKFIVSHFFAFIFLFQYSYAQIKFQDTTHDFGEIREEDEYATHTFLFVNGGDKPVKISRVKASCGCTTPGWTKDEVMPGDSGFVQARYNTRNRPGKFRKSLKVTTIDPASNQMLYIQGFVKPKPKTPEEQFPVIAGNFRLPAQTFNFGKITTEKSITKRFDIYNNGDSLATLPAMKLPAHIRVELSPNQLAPKSEGQIAIIYDPILKNDYGYVSDYIGFGQSSASFSVMAIIEEYFPKMTDEELNRAPKLELSSQVFDFGELTRGDKIETTFDLTNTGVARLEFRAIKSNCDCITYEFKNKSLKKQKSTTLKVLLDTSELRGNQYKSISVYSNDPVNPTKVITIKGRVKNQT